MVIKEGEDRRSEQESRPLRQVTICFALREGEILLAMKKRGFGEGKWNGAGGKVEEGSVRKGAKRECLEEFGIEIELDDLEKVAEITFVHPEIPTLEGSWLAHVFIVRKWQGEPRETEEMLPQWFPLEDIPYEEMWTDDVFWLPRVLSGEKIIARIVLDEKSETLDAKIEPIFGFPS